MILKTNFAGLEFSNPIMPASGPLTGDYKKMKYLAELGVGGMVTKTISTKAAEVIRPCIFGSKNFLINNELWTEFSPEKWTDEFLPECKKNLDMPLIISAGYTKEDMEILIPQLDPFADAFEISTHYVGTDLLVIGKTVETIRKHTKKPIFMKVSPHISDPVAFARVVIENGGTGVVTINSLGPTLNIDLDRRCAVLGGDKGYAWMSGSAIKPIALAFVHQIKQSIPQCVVIGTGGVKTADDVLEFLLAGADGVQLLSSALLFGKDIYEKIVNDLPSTLEKYGFSSIEEVKATMLGKNKDIYQPSYPVIDEKKCTGCKICEKVCPYFAMEVDIKAKVNESECFGCGLCQSKCPTKAITNVL